LDSTIHDNRANFTRVMSNLGALSTTLNKNSDAMANAIQNLSVVSDSLAKIEFASTMARANDALADVSSITSSIASGQGTLGKLVVNDSLYTGLVATNNELQLLLDDLQLHPWKYVQVNLIGRKPKSEFSKKDIQRLRKIIEEELEAAEAGSQDQ
jgi:phospholipid/cholesterol/gamma-HCH transport system substrate-binding protein